MVNLFAGRGAGTTSTVVASCTPCRCTASARTRYVRVPQVSDIWVSPGRKYEIERRPGVHHTRGPYTAAMSRNNASNDSETHTVAKIIGAMQPTENAKQLGR